MDKHAAEYEHPSHQEQPTSSPSSTYFVSKMVKNCCSNHDPKEDNGSCVCLITNQIPLRRKDGQKKNFS